MVDESGAHPQEAAVPEKHAHASDRYGGHGRLADHDAITVMHETCCVDPKQQARMV